MSTRKDSKIEMKSISASDALAVRDMLDRIIMRPAMHFVTKQPVSESVGLLTGLNIAYDYLLFRDIKEWMYIKYDVKREGRTWTAIALERYSSEEMPSERSRLDGARFLIQVARDYLTDQYDLES